ncbi:MAG: 23S rRNA pseudouridine(955/2504/2580) synthase RluC [Gammaproteobacteria bacterium]|nr:23S rRNA pseudouridine(955/2504/2580) synthase RluC [Gammaproteobacteria bacterium]
MQAHAQPPPAGAYQLIVDAHGDGQRIDNFLFTRLKGVPKSRIYRILRTGEVRVNRGRIRQDYRLKEGDVVRVPPLRRAEKAPAPSPDTRALDLLRDRVLFEDRALLVLDKPSGLAVHGGSGLSYGVIEALRALRPEAPFLELVHRLDRETSGCLVVAKRRPALRALHALLREGEVTKTYLALVGGDLPRPIEVRASLRKNVLQSGERVVRASEEGKAALTRIEPLDRAGTVTLVRATPQTGRTHQIRVHAAEAGHPVAGDAKYGDPELNRTLRTAGLRRLFLHAQALRFPHPEAGDPVNVVAPLPAELRTVLAALGIEA